MDNIGTQEIIHETAKFTILTLVWKFQHVAGYYEVNLCLVPDSCSLSDSVYLD